MAGKTKESTFDERTRYVPPYLDGDGNQVNGAGDVTPEPRVEVQEGPKPEDFEPQVENPGSGAVVSRPTPEEVEEALKAKAKRRKKQK